MSDRPVRSSADDAPGELGTRSLPGACGIGAAVAGLAGAWIAAGSTGLLGHPLRHGLTWLAIGVILIAARPCRQHLWRQVLLLAAAVAVAVPMTASPLAPINVLAVALVLLAAAAGQASTHRQPILLAAEAVVVLALYRLAATSIPLVWQAADAVGTGLGHVAGVLTGRPLWIGATLSGVDLLVTMLYVAARVPLQRNGLFGTAPSSRPQKPFAIAAVLLGQFLFLLLLTLTADVFESLPQLRPGTATSAASPAAATGGAVPAAEQGGNVPARLAGLLLPWNAPILLLVLDALLVWGILRQIATSSPQSAAATAATPQRLRWPRVAAATAAAVLAALLPVLTSLCWHRPELEGKKIVVYEKGFLNWLKPEHGQYGQYSAGMYGMLPIYVESLGATCLRSPGLSDEDLAGADALILLFPNQPWEEGQLECIWRFVSAGGTLLVMGEHTIREADGGNRFNDVLEPTAMRVRFDSATFAVGGWIESYQALAHPTTAGIPDEQNDFGVVIGASLSAPWPARPLLVGRWGWADPGNPYNVAGAMMGNHLYDPGEKLGDLVLAAEQPFGRGKVIVFGDTSSLTNGLTVNSHRFTSRLLAYLVDGSCTPQAAWRQWAGLLLGAVLLGLVAWRADAWRLAVLSLSLAASLGICTSVTSRLWEVLPDGRRQSPNNLAYIDASHANDFSRDSWRADGTMALSLTLMRNGYLTLLLPELSRERLERAGVLVCIAPGREFSAAERQVIREFLEEGGIFILTVGYDRLGPSGSLLADFGFCVGETPTPEGQTPAEPQPLGHFKSEYFKAPSGEYAAYVRFYAAWAVHCNAEHKREVAYGYTTEQPVIVVRRIEKQEQTDQPGSGKRGYMMVIGDSCFALNKNLENPDGSPIEGMRENADFWRCLLAWLSQRQRWDPPRPAASKVGSE